jgi:hypothetical protein
MLTRALPLLLVTVITFSAYLTSFTNSFIIRGETNRRFAVVPRLTNIVANRGDREFSGRGAERFSNDARNRLRSSDQREGFPNGIDSKMNEMSYDSASETEVTRLHAPEDRVSLDLLQDGQKMRGRIVSVKE